MVFGCKTLLQWSILHRFGQQIAPLTTNVVRLCAQGMDVLQLIRALPLGPDKYWDALRAANASQKTFDVPFLGAPRQHRGMTKPVIRSFETIDHLGNSQPSCVIEEFPEGG